MSINFKIKGADINNDTKTYTEEKMQMLLKYLDDTDSPRFDVEFSESNKHISGDVYRVDLVVVSGGLDLHTVGHGESYNAAIDMAKDDMARRLRRGKSKSRDMLRKGSRAIKKMLRMNDN
jgi:ribosomal subunit interface protein